MRKLLLVAASVFALSACASSNDSSATTQSTADTITSDVTTPKQREEFTLTVGENTGRDVVLQVEKGTEVVLTAVNPNSADEIHLHGYDLTTGTIKKGQEAVVTFTAITAGDFEIESHETGELLAILRVTSS